MTGWQKRTRLGVAVFGLASAVAVYTAMRERPAPVRPAEPPPRIDPAAIIESSGAIVQQVRGAKQDFRVKAEQQLTYEGGATRLVGVEISVQNRGGRDFVIRAREAQAGERQQELHLKGTVELQASDGFRLSTEEASFSEVDGQVRAPGAFTFSRGQLTGQGVGMAYDRTADVLSILGSADIRLVDAGGNTLTQFTAGTAVFTRPQHLITLGDTVHVLHNDQIADAERAAAHLSEDDSRLTRVELRGAAEVGGRTGGIERLRARSIDMDYAADGLRLSHVLLDGEAALATTGQGESAGRDIRGGRLDITLDDQEEVRRIIGREGVSLTLAASGSVPARTIEARDLDAEGRDGGGLKDARFSGNVVFREGGRRDGRIVRSRTLRAALTDAGISAATFAGEVRFEEEGLQAAAAEAAYAPEAGSLRLSGRDSVGSPRVTDDQISVEASTITVQTASRAMTASGTVKTVLQPRAQTGGSPGRGKGLPGLFQQGAPASGSADTFEYAGATGLITYAGGATLWQGETTVRGDRITIDQDAGDLRVVGAARSSIALATGNSASRSAQMAFVDRTRTLTYQGDESALAFVSGPAGDLRAATVVVTLESPGNRVDRLTAKTSVTLTLDERTVTGSALTYVARDEQYVMTGSARAPVKIVEACRETTGATLTFYKSADRIVIDGNQQARTQSIRGAGCAEPARR